MTPRHSVLLALAIALATTAASVPTAQACIQISGTSVGGDKLYVQLPYHGEVVDHLTDHTEHQRRAMAPLGPTPAEDASWEVRSDHAALLLYRGRAVEAIAILESVERQHPGEYAVAANLGTAYELAGNDGEALRWITEGTRRNPESHDGTEWLHVRILEAKLGLATDPAWLQSHRVLDVDFGTGIAPVVPSVWPEGQDFESTLRALSYQLHERTGFVKPPDPIVGELLAVYADLIAIQYAIEVALPVYDLALEYQPVGAAAIRERRDRLAQRASSSQREHVVTQWGPFVGVVLALVAVPGAAIWLLVRRRRRGRVVRVGA